MSALTNLSGQKSKKRASPSKAKFALSHRSGVRSTADAKTAANHTRSGPNGQTRMEAGAFQSPYSKMKKPKIVPLRANVSVRSVNNVSESPKYRSNFLKAKPLTKL